MLRYIEIMADGCLLRQIFLALPRENRGSGVIFQHRHRQRQYLVPKIIGHIVLIPVRLEI